MSTISQSVSDRSSANRRTNGRPCRAVDVPVEVADVVPRLVRPQLARTPAPCPASPRGRPPPAPATAPGRTRNRSRRGLPDDRRGVDGRGRGGGACGGRARS